MICSDTKVCVATDTPFESLVKELLPEQYIVLSDDGVLDIDNCNALAGHGVDISVPNVRANGYEGAYQVGRNQYSKNPLALVTREEDVQWSKFVFWIVSSLFHAEDGNISQVNAQEMPVVNVFGAPFTDMFRNAVGAVGNYGEIYTRNIGNSLRRSSLNLVNEDLKGPQHYPYIL